MHGSVARDDRLAFLTAALRPLANVDELRVRDRNSRTIEQDAAKASGAPSQISLLNCPCIVRLVTWITHGLDALLTTPPVKWPSTGSIAVIVRPPPSSVTPSRTKIVISVMQLAVPNRQSLQSLRPADAGDQLRNYRHVDLVV